MATNVVATLVEEGVIDTQMENSLTSKVANAEKSSDKDNICPAINQLEAFKNQIEAQKGNNISDEAAELLIAYANNILAKLEAKLLSLGESC